MHAVVLSGGTATNSLVNLFPAIFSQVSYVLPVSDNGGSTSEIIRVIGGPGIGDCRSRIVRLIPEGNATCAAFRNLFSYRLPDSSPESKEEWLQIVDGTHPKWNGIESQHKEMFRAFFIQIHSELLRRSRPRKEFNFDRASIGNLFLSGARLFCGSLDSAVELMCRLTMVPNNASVIPSINTTFSYHISAQLHDGTIITGQSQISHPAETPSSRGVATVSNTLSSSSPYGGSDVDQVAAMLHARLVGNITPFELPAVSASAPNTPMASESVVGSSSGSSVGSGLDVVSSVDSTNRYPLTTPSSPVNFEDASLPFSHPDLVASQLKFSKEKPSPLPSPIHRIYYVNPYGQEIHPRGSERFLKSVARADAVVYSIGSLYTSTIPIVLLEGFAVNVMSCKKKIYLLNGCEDRETAAMSGFEHIEALVEACLYSMTPPIARTVPPPVIEAEQDNIYRLWEQSKQLINSLPWTSFVTDVIYLKNGTIRMDIDEFIGKGIRCHAVGGKLGIYNETELQNAIQRIMSL